jgi:hypothetical protein
MIPGTRSTCCALVLAAACGRAEGGPLARPIVDTLPNGAAVVHNEAPALWREPGAGWRFEEVWRTTGDPETPSELINPQSLAVDGAGRVYVADRTPAVIKVFDAGGRFLRTIRREGQGPGEFRVAFLAARGGHLVVHDPQTSRTSVFDTSGAFLRSWHSACCYWTGIYVDRAERIYIPSPLASEENIQALWLRYGMDGSPLDTVRLYRPPGAVTGTWTVRSGSGGNQAMMMTTVPFSPTLQTTFDPDGGFVIGWSADYALTVTRSGTDTVQVFGRRWTPVPVTEQARRDTVDSMVSRMARNADPAPFRSAFRPGDIPNTLPAFLALRVDETGHRWIRLGAAEGGGVLYDVFSPEGTWLGTARVPASFSPWAAQYWGDRELVLTLTDEDGLPVLAKYQVVGR